MEQIKKFFKIIIPNYNNEKYLRRCFDSILTQSFEDFFIVAIDDKSTDSSASIMAEYKAKYPEKFDFIVQTRRQLQGTARNDGYDYNPQNFKYEYVWCVDSDDYIQKDSLEKIYNKLKENKFPDLIYINFSYETKAETKINTKVFEIKTLEHLVNAEVNPFVKVIKFEKFVYFPENLLLSEDVIQHIKQVDNISTFIVDLKNSYYVYNKTNVSSTLTNGSECHTIRTNQLFKMLNEVINIVPKHDYVKKKIKWKINYHLEAAIKKLQSFRETKQKKK